MDQEMRTMGAELRRKAPPEAVDWLIQHFPIEGDNWGKAITLLEHASFPKREAAQLATYYLSRAPYASDRTYRLFAKFLGLAGMLEILGRLSPQFGEKSELLLYHLNPLLEEATSENDQLAVSAFVANLNASE
ncbi:MULTISPECIES: hypothetical protein [unclassified Sphingopyxis]|uniref:hypothetical protein n=1 Tax=unclassified Sphingopyxis TaxID=2614943 RepID=UPI00285CB2CB|nr:MULTISPECIES: hypothetical protein [unclassified Sphingopyxis]MDR7059374.1 hypothetical protein [Sphingopyxis sp. BE235]MDR7178440.1 hypothetical protein [Sphingopyxis sp. BE249]